MVHRVGVVTLLLAAATTNGPAKADPCIASFVKVMTDQSPKGAIRSRSTTTLPGQKPMISINHQSANGDWMTEVVEPAGMPWSLTIGKVMYSSSDKGKTWRKVRELNDAGHDPSTVQKEQREAADTAANVVCGFEAVDQKRLEKIEGDVSYPKMNMTARLAYWIEPETRRVVRSWQRLSVGGGVTEIASSIEYVADLTLPRP